MGIAIPNLQTANSVSGNDLLIVVVNPETLEETKNVTITTFFSNVAIGNVTFGDKRTPANSTITALQGRLFYDDNYLYVATANNNIKRISLGAF